MTSDASNPPKLSVVIPYYNGKDFIRNTVSILNALEISHEILVINDGSTDGSLQLLNDLSKEDQQVHVYSKENNGITSARNYGIDKATGEYIFFVDQDDFPVPSTIQKAVNILDANGNSMLIWATNQKDTDGNVSPFSHVKNKNITTHQEIISSVLPVLLFSRSNNDISVLGQIWSILFRRKFIEDNRIRFKKFIDYDDDNVFIFDALCSANSISLMSDVGYTYLVRNDSYSRGIKYYKDYYEKLMSFNQYYLTNSQKAGLEISQLDKYSRYREQVTVLKLLFNHTLNPNEKEWMRIKKYYHQIKNNIKNEMLFESNRLNKFYFFCLKFGFLKPIVMAYRYKLKRKYGNWSIIVR